MAIIDNNSQNRGLGRWRIFIYNPSSSIGTFDGYLIVNKDFHIIYKDEKFLNCIFNVPSQNVAFAINENLSKDYKIEK